MDGYQEVIWAIWRSPPSSSAATILESVNTGKWWFRRRDAHWLYAYLPRLEAEGLVTGYQEHVSGPSRRLYILTKLGLDQAYDIADKRAKLK